MSKELLATAKVHRSRRAWFAFMATVSLLFLAADLGKPFLFSLESPHAAYCWIGLPIVFVFLPMFLWLHYEQASREIRLDSESFSFGRGRALPVSAIRNVDRDLSSDAVVRIVERSDRATHVDFKSANYADAFVARLRQANVPVGFYAQSVAPARYSVGLSLLILLPIVTLGALAIFLKFPHISVPQMFLGAFGGLLASALRVLAPTMEMRPDGVGLTSPFGGRFIRFSEVTRVERRDNAVCITTKRGEVHRAVFSPERVAGVLETLRAAHESYLSHAAISVGQDLELGSQQGDVWKAHVRLPSSSYRERAHPTDQLEAVVAHRSAPATARVAAAVKLVNEGSDEAKAKIRIAAAETASPKLRIALEKAANGEVDAALDEAIEAERAT